MHSGQSDIKPGNGLTGEKGSVLIIVLVVMAIGVGLSLYVTGTAKDVVGSAFMLEDKLKAKLEAESQLETVRFLLATNPFSASWVQLRDRSFAPSLPERFDLTGVPVKWRDSVVKLRDTASMFSVPWSGPVVLKRLLLAFGGTPGQAAQAADGLRDWIDADDFKHLNGAEVFDYRQQGVTAWSPRNSRIMQAKEELGLVARLQQFEAWPQLAEQLVWTPRGGTNLSTASVTMLQALLDIPAEQATQLVERRRLQGRLGESDLLQIIGNKGGLDDGTNASFPSRIVVVQIVTTIGQAREHLSAVLDFVPNAQVPVTTLRYEP